VAKPDLGEKQLCPECEKKFYDLAKRPAVCPYCATSFDPAEIAVVAATPKPVKTSPNKKDEDLDDEDVEVEEVDEEDVDQDEAVAKELELDGDASFGGSGGEDGDDDLGNDTPDMDGFSTDDEDEGGISGDDDEEQDVLPPMGNDESEDDEEEDEE